MKKLISFMSIVAIITMASCSGSSSSENSSEPMVPVTRRVMESESNRTVANLSISGMTCSAGCGGKIQQELRKLAGVKNTELDYADNRPANTVSVEFDPAVISEKEMINCVTGISDGAYGVQKVEIIDFHGLQNRPSAASDAGVSAPDFGRLVYVMNLLQSVTNLVR